MKKYQVKKYFEWGSLRLEPLQYLLIEESTYPNSYKVTSEKNNKSIVVNKKAFQNYLAIGYFQEV